MSTCYYKIVQDNRKGGSKLWYGRAVTLGEVKLAEIAERIEHNCSMTKGDCLNVLTELIVVMRDELSSGKKVTLDGFGSFKIGMSSTGTVTEEAYDIKKNRKNNHVNFVPTGTRNESGTLTRTFCDNINWEYIASIQKEKKKEES